MKTARIDWESFAEQIEFCMAAGVHGLVVPALASEFFTLSDAERRQVVEFASDAIAGRAPFRRRRTRAESADRAGIRRARL